VVDAKRSRLRTKLERIVASANRRRPENQLRASHHRDHQDRRIVTTEIAAS
jgi:hypothetical protein